MLDPNLLLKALAAADIRFVTGVPDSLLKDACACISEKMAAQDHVIATNEGSAIALAAGHHLATGRLALVYLQNSGLGNAINPIASLADPSVYGIPMVLMVGWRGEIGPDGVQLRDEPQHEKQGQITIPQLDLLGIPWEVIGPETTALASIVKRLASAARERGGPAALVVRHGTFGKYASKTRPVDVDMLTREEAITHILKGIPATIPVVCTTGMASRELFALRTQSNAGHSRDFLTVGSMGHASLIAAGIAHASPTRKVLCIDGDGAMLMHMGALAISGSLPNLIHVVINNGVHDSVGGQPTKAASLALAGIAAACGYETATTVMDAGAIGTALAAMIRGRGSSFLEIKCRPGARPGVGRPDRRPEQNKEEFMKFLQEKPGGS